MMVERGTLDTAKPILTMGGSAGSGVAAAVNAGSPSKTLKATPKEVPRILLPDGTVKRVTPRMMARLMGLPDTFHIPEGHGLAKTVLGNGVSGEVTRSLIQPLIDRPTPTEAVVEEIATPIEDPFAGEPPLPEGTPNPFGEDWVPLPAGTPNPFLEAPTPTEAVVEEESETETESEEEPEPKPKPRPKPTREPVG